MTSRTMLQKSRWNRTKFEDPNDVPLPAYAPEVEEGGRGGEEVVYLTRQRSLSSIFRIGFRSRYELLFKFVSRNLAPISLHVLSFRTLYRFCSQS